MRRSWRGAAAYIWLALGFGCAPPAPNTIDCVAAQQAPLVGAEAAPSWLGLSEEMIAATGSLQNEEGRVVCTASLVAPGWLLTARHCLRGGPVWFQSSHTTRQRVRTLDEFLHPSRDVALIRLYPRSGLADRAQPIETSDVLPFLEPGELLTMVGFGLDEWGLSGERRYLREPLVEVDANHLIVDGSGRTGACEGDSGGPLLWRAAHGEGEAVLLGVLSRGSASCTGLDRYERVDNIRDWIKVRIAQVGPNPCGIDTWEGQCTTQGVRYCLDGEVQLERCEPGASCVFDFYEMGYRCSSSPDTPPMECPMQ